VKEKALLINQPSVALSPQGEFTVCPSLQTDRKELGTTRNGKKINRLAERNPVIPT
jgi:hypothetical protein